MIPDMNKDQEALLISLTRPVIYVQPVSFDKGQPPTSGLLVV